MSHASIYFKIGLQNIDSIVCKLLINPGPDQLHKTLDGRREPFILVINHLGVHAKIDAAPGKFHLLISLYFFFYRDARQNCQPQPAHDKLLNSFDIFHFQI